VFNFGDFVEFAKVDNKANGAIRFGNCKAGESPLGCPTGFEDTELALAVEFSFEGSLLVHWNSIGLLDMIGDGSVLESDMEGITREFTKGSVRETSKEFRAFLPNSKKVGLLAGRQMGLFTSQGDEISGFIFGSGIKVGKVRRLSNKAVGTIGFHS
jgi:hypothetical protein